MTALTEIAFRADGAEGMFFAVAEERRAVGAGGVQGFIEAVGAGMMAAGGQMLAAIAEVG